MITDNILPVHGANTATFLSEAPREHNAIKIFKKQKNIQAEIMRIIAKKLSA